MDCKFCNAPMEDDMTVCPVCGKDVTEETAAEEVVVAEETAEECTCECAPEETAEECTCEECTCEETPVEEAPKKKGKTVLAWIAAILVVAIVAVGAAAFLKPTAPVEDVVLMGSETGYTVSAEEMTEEVSGAVIASAKKMNIVRQLQQKLGLQSKLSQGITNAELSIYYWDSFYNFYNTYGYYAMMLGLDPATMDTSPSMTEGQTWQEFFLSQALNLYRSQIAVCETAQKKGYTLSTEMQEELDAQLESLNTMEDLEVLLTEVYGPGITKEMYTDYIRQQYIYSGYLSELEAGLTFTDEELAAYYDENAETYEMQGIYKDVEAVDSKAEAERIYAEWQAGEATEDSFAALATTYTTDPGSAETGGLYENVYVGQMVPSFNDWCFDEARQVGDTGIVETDYGHHIMYFVGRNDDETINVRHILLQSSDPDAWKETVSADYASHTMTDLIKTMSQRYALDYDTSKIALALPAQITG